MKCTHKLILWVFIVIMHLFDDSEDEIYRNRYVQTGESCHMVFCVEEEEEDEGISLSERTQPASPVNETI